MIRSLLAALGGGAMALGLFWLLALLVAPPEQTIERPDVSAPLRLASPAPQEAPSPSLAEAEAESLSERPDAIALSEPDPQPEPTAAPEPVPEPTPEPTPVPEPESIPDPAPAPQPEPVSAAPSEPLALAAEASKPADAALEAVSTAEPASQGSQASDVPVAVGEAIPVNRVPPNYPRRALRRGLEGYVELEFLIQPDGRVDPSSIRVLEARPRRAFEAAAESAVAEWRFESDGRLRRARQRLEFQLR
ncbi:MULTISPECIES: TonB family protein [Halomonas]|uniref:Protein TonB n=1 Tax=Halomonas ventosae TaxID=229007 RepID=A0A4R6HVC2_9GAMM|nr:TonB family protein [Halomonas ventosae]TDO12636.1 outer membrane transport energization protein TonB [Halomonas ventosae]